MDKYYLATGKNIINEGDLIDFQQFIESYKTYIDSVEYNFTVTLFKDLFIHACQQGKLDIVKELYNHYLIFGDIERIGLKPTFTYCKYICKSENNKNVKEFLDSKITK